MKRKLAYLLGISLLLVFDADGVRQEYLRSCLLREDVRPWANAVLDVLSAVGGPAGATGFLILSALALTCDRQAGWRSTTLAPAAAALIVWIFSAPHSAYSGPLCSAVGIWIALRFLLLGFSGSRHRLTSNQLVVSVGLLVGLELALRHIHSAPLCTSLFALCGPDPLSGLVVWSGLAVATVLGILAGTDRRARLAGAVLSLLVAAVAGGAIPQWRIPEGPAKPADLVWFSAGPRNQKVDVSFPVGWPDGPPRTLREAQDRAILAGDVVAHREVWNAIMAERPLSLGIPASALWEEMWWREEHGESSEDLMAYLSSAQMEEKPVRRVVQGRAGAVILPAAGLPLRLVRSADSLEPIGRLRDLEGFRDSMWLHQPQGTRRMELQPCTASEVVMTDKEGDFSFKHVTMGTWSLLAGLRQIDIYEDSAHWKPLLVKENVPGLKVGFASNRTQDQPRNLEFDQPLGSVWSASGNYTHDLAAGTIRFEKKGQLTQIIDAKPFRGKRLRVSMDLRNIDFAPSSDNVSMLLELRSAGSHYASISAMQMPEDPPGTIKVVESRTEWFDQNRKRREETLRDWPLRLVTETQVPISTHHLRITCRFSELSSVVLESVTLEEVAP